MAKISVRNILVSVVTHFGVGLLSFLFFVFTFPHPQNPQPPTPPSNLPASTPALAPPLVPPLSTPSAETAASMQDYKSEDFGYSLKLPANWKIYAEDQPFFYFRGCEVTSCPGPDENYYDLKLQVRYNPKQLSVEKYFRDPSRVYDFNKIKTTKNFTISNYAATLLSVELPNGYAKELVVISQGKLLYEFQTYGLENKQRDEILKTFHFDGDEKNIIKHHFSYQLTDFHLPSLTNSLGDQCSTDQILSTYDANGNPQKLVVGVSDFLPKDFKEYKKTHCNLQLDEYVFPENKSKLFFKAGLAETDEGAYGFYSYDIPTHTFAEMKISRYFPAFGDDAVSADGLQVIAIDRSERFVEKPEPQNIPEPSYGKKLYLLDLMKDEAKTLVTLKGKETLLRGFDFGQENGEVTWIDDHTLQYAVYDRGNSTDFENHPDRPLLAKRTVKIP